MDWSGKASPLARLPLYALPYLIELAAVREDTVGVRADESYGAHRSDDQRGHRKGNSVYNSVCWDEANPKEHFHAHEVWVVRSGFLMAQPSRPDLHRLHFLLLLTAVLGR
jgi:hypothetical protein